MTTPGAQGISVPAISADNALVFVPLGDQGILVLFGAGYLVRHPPFPSPTYTEDESSPVPSRIQQAPSWSP